MIEKRFGIAIMGMLAVGALASCGVANSTSVDSMSGVAALEDGGEGVSPVPTAIVKMGAKNTGEVTEIEMPDPSYYYEKDQVYFVATGMEGLGFTDITLIPTPNVKGKDWEGSTILVSVNGDESFSEGDTFPSDAKVAISFYGVYGDSDSLDDEEPADSQSPEGETTSKD